MKKKISALMIAAVFLSGSCTVFAGDNVVRASSTTLTAQTTVNGKTVTFEISGDGQLDLTGVPNGDYQFTFSAADFAPRTYNSVTVASGGFASGLENGVELHRLGDINGDGVVNTQDVAKANAHVKGTSTLKDYELACINVNVDNNINVQDVALMNAHAKNTKTLWDASAYTTPTLTTQITTSSGSKVDFSHLAEQLSYPDLKVNKRIKWMAWWPMDETSGEAELFKEAYGIPETGDDPYADGRIFEYISIDYGSRYDKLAMAIAADQSPDLFPFELVDFPYGVFMNRYQAVDDIVNFNDAKWAATKGLNDQFMLNGKHYTAFWSYTLSDLMWYKKSNIKAIGKDDPQELFAKGKWDWDSFLDIARAWQQSGSTDNPRFATDGYSVDGSIVISTGVPMIGTDGSKLVSNLRSAELERAVGLIETLQKENLRYPRHEINEWMTNPRAWADDTTLFFCEGTWRYEEDLQALKKRFKWADDEIRVVPYPKDPKADKHYVQIRVDVPMWVKGSKNPEGVQAWYDCCVTASKDKALHEASNAEMIKNPKRGYTQEIVDFLDNLYGYNGESPVTPIVEFKTGLGPTVYDSTLDAPVTAVISKVYLLGNSFVQLRDMNEPVILKTIEDINARL